MTPQRAKELLPVITAFSEGKTIQYRNNISPDWKDWGNYSFVLDNYTYRIKPEPKFRPWKPEEVPVGALLRVRGGNGIYQALIVARSADYVYYAQGKNACYASLHNYEYSHDHGLSWHPCGVIEES